MTAEKPSEVAWKAAQCLGNCDDFRCCADSPDWAAEIIDRQAVAPAVQKLVRGALNLIEALDQDNGSYESIAAVIADRDRLADLVSPYRHLIEGEGE